MALVRKIIPQSTVDGPGNRTAIFLQGCNIRCAYCHNPETQPLHDNEASEMDIPLVLNEIRKGIPFIRGITVSGGECMLQADWLTSLFSAVKSLQPSLTCLIDSNGTIPFARYPQLMQLTDGVMLDVKAWDESTYQQLTHAHSNSIVKENLFWLLEHDLLTEVRIVCLPEINHNPAGKVQQSHFITTDVENILVHLAEIPLFISKNIPVKLLRFRPHGVIGMLATYPMPSDQQMNTLLAQAHALHLNARVK